MGARFAGMGDASVALYDPWNSTGNTAGIARQEQAWLGASQEIQPLLPGANRRAFAVVVPVRPVVATASFFTFGDDLYREQVSTIGVAHQAGIAALGIAARYIRYQAYGFGTRNRVGIDLGGVVAFNSRVQLGAHLTNINQPVLSHETGEHLPMRMALGVCVLPSDHVTLALSMTKSLVSSPIVHFGLEYKPVARFAFRTGFQVLPLTGFIGLGFTTSRLQLDYALRYNQLFQATHQATVSYPFKKS